jgi:O-succinylbenzoate synthase
VTSPGRPSPEDLVAGLRVVVIPMRVPFRGVAQREVALVRGPAGWGEFAPFLEYDDQASSRWLVAAMESAWEGWPEPVRTEVAVNATVPAVAAVDVAAVLERFDGCRTVKVKVAERGESLADDLARVGAVRDWLGPDGRIRVDANGAWSLDDAQRAVTALHHYDLEYAEQPCADVADLARLRVRLARAGVDVPIAADESIRRAEDPVRVAREEAADVIVVKVAPLGGVRRALALVAECGLPAVVSSALDTSVGIAAGVALAAALPALPYACGLGTVELLAGDVVSDSLVPRRGVIGVHQVLLAAPTEELLDRFAAPPDRVRWWRARATRCYEAHPKRGCSRGLNPPASRRQRAM